MSLHSSQTSPGLPSHSPPLYPHHPSPHPSPSLSASHPLPPQFLQRLLTYAQDKVQRRKELLDRVEGERDREITAQVRHDAKLLPLRGGKTERREEGTEGKGEMGTAALSTSATPAPYHHKMKAQGSDRLLSFSVQPLTRLLLSLRVRILWQMASRFVLDDGAPPQGHTDAPTDSSDGLCLPAMFMPGGGEPIPLCRCRLLPMQPQLHPHVKPHKRS